jgi:hypothetical protein
MIEFVKAEHAMDRSTTTATKRVEEASLQLTQSALVLRLLHA